MELNKKAKPQGVWQGSLIIYTIYTELHYVIINRSVYDASTERFRTEVISTVLPPRFQKKSGHNVHYSRNCLPQTKSGIKKRHLFKCDLFYTFRNINNNIIVIVKQVISLITILPLRIEWACDFHQWCCLITWLNLQMMTIRVFTPVWLNNNNLNVLRNKSQFCSWTEMITENILARCICFLLITASPWQRTCLN